MTHTLSPVVRRLGLSVMTLVFTWCVQAAQFQHLSSPNDTASLAYIRLYREIQNHPVVKDKLPATTSLADPFALSIMFELVDIYDLNEIAQVITIIAYIEIEWKHHYIHWNISDFENVREIHIASSDIWTPSLLVVLGTKETLTLDIPDLVTLDHSGLMTARIILSLSFSCAIDFKKYPFDEQRCRVGFYPVYPSPVDFSIKALPFNLSPFFMVHGEWNVLGGIRHEIVNSTEHSLVSYPRFEIRMKRQYYYYVITILFPMLLTSVMIPLVFLIPTQTGEKVSYLVALFTSTAVFLNYISDVMPRGLSTMPYMATLLVSVMSEGLLAMLATLYTIQSQEQPQHDTSNGHSKGSKVHPTPFCPPVIQRQDSSEYQSDVSKWNVLTLKLHAIRSRILAVKHSLWNCPHSIELSTKLNKFFFTAFVVCQTTFLTVVFAFWLSD